MCLKPGQHLGIVKCSTSSRMNCASWTSWMVFILDGKHVGWCAWWMVCIEHITIHFGHPFKSFVNIKEFYLVWSELVRSIVSFERIMQFLHWLDDTQCILCIHLLLIVQSCTTIRFLLNEHRSSSNCILCTFSSVSFPSFFCSFLAHCEVHS